MSGHFGWKLLEMMPERIALLIGIACAPPGNIQPLPLVLREDPEVLHLQRFAGSTVQKIRRGQAMSMSREAADFKLIGPGTQFPRAYADRYINTLIPVPFPLILARMNFQGSAPRIIDEAALRDKRIILVHGTDDPDTRRRSSRAWPTGSMRPGQMRRATRSASTESPAMGT